METICDSIFRFSFFLKRYIFNFLIFFVRELTLKTIKEKETSYGFQNINISIYIYIYNNKSNIIIICANIVTLHFYIKEKLYF